MTKRPDQHPGSRPAPPAHPFEPRQGQGPLAGLDPRAKFLAALGFTLLVALSTDHASLLCGLLAGGLLLAFSGLNPRALLKRSLAVNLFVLFLWLFLPWQIAWNGGGLQLKGNPGWFEAALGVTLKVNAIFLVFNAFVAATRINDLLHALAHLKLPHKLVILFLLFHRYIFVIHGEYLRLLQAMKVRGFRPGSNLHTYKSLANLVGMLLVRSFERSERVYQAMLCRGFSGTFWLLDHFHWHRRDWVFCWLWLAVLCAIWLAPRALGNGIN